jgi:hypothetical protein
MKAHGISQERVRLEVPLGEGRELASAIIHQAEDMPSVALDLAYLLREADYAARDPFRLPPGEEGV